MKKYFIAVGLLSFLVFTGCASINSVSLTSIPIHRNNQVTAEVSKVIVLGLNFNNDYVDELTDDLRAKCPNGQIVGVLTKDQVIDYFIMIVYKRDITASGYCLQSHRRVSMNSTAGLR